MYQEKKQFYDSLLTGEKSVQLALNFLQENQALYAAIEADLLPIMGKKDLKTLPKFIKEKEKHLKKALLNDTLAPWENCPPLLASFTHFKIAKKENKVLPLILALQGTLLPNITALCLFLDPKQSDHLSEWLGQLPHLTTLILNSSKLTELPNTLYELDQLPHLELGNNNLTDLPQQLGQLKQLETLVLNANKLEFLPNSLTQLTQLTTLKLTNNKFTSLPKVVCQLTTLTCLELQNNKLEVLPESFGNLKQLTTLKLGSNKLTLLPTSFEYLQQLVTLELHSNKLVALPNYLEKLQTLKASKNKITALSDTFGKYACLNSLELDYNKITTLPTSFGQLEQLSYLSITDNGLQRLPDSFGQLKKLNTLYLSNNDLLYIPDSFGQLQLLSDLRLSTSELPTLPESFGQLQNLRKLSLSTLQLTALPQSFGQLQNLSWFLLSGQELTTLPESFGQLQNLSQFSLYITQFTTFPESFGQLQNLKELTISGQQFTTFPESFGQLQNLKELTISGQQFTTFPESFGQLSIKKLTIRYTSLTTLPESFGQLQQLKELSLPNNKLTTLPDSIGQLQQLSSIILTDNKFSHYPPQLHSLEKTRIYIDKLPEKAPLVVEETVIAPIKTQEAADEVKQTSAPTDPQVDAAFIQVCTLLESRSPAALEEALAVLERDPALKKRAEKRYLAFIRGVSKKPNATLQQINEVAYDEATVKAILEDFTPGGFDTISMYNVDSDSLDLFSDFAGALIASHLDVKAYIAQAGVFTQHKDLMQFIVNTEKQLHKALLKDAYTYTQGWFGQLYQHCIEVNIQRMTFDHVYDCGFNSSCYIDEFWIFLGVFLGDRQLQIDVFQAESIDITPATFLLQTMPFITTQEGNTSFTEHYPLLIERSITCKGPDIYDRSNPPKYALGKINLYKTYH